jgi:HAMP domain-containing protein
MALLCLATSSLLLWAAHSTVVDFRRAELISAALRVVHLIKEHDLPRTISLELYGPQVVDSSGRVVSSTPNLVDAPRLTTMAPDPDNANRMSVLSVLALASAALVALTWFGVSRVVARTLAPVNSITRRLAEITVGDGALRVPVPGNADEIKALAETANQTLARLQSATRARPPGSPRWTWPSWSRTRARGRGRGRSSPHCSPA